MTYLKFCFVLLCVNFVLSEEDICSESDPCKCVIRKDSKVIDLSSVGSFEHPRFYELALPSNFNTTSCTTELYSYNPCFPFNSPDKFTTVADGYSSCTEASACIKKPGGSDGSLPEEHAIGLQNTAKFGYHETSDSYYINYTVPNSKSKKLQVQLNCSTKSTAHTLSIVQPDCLESGTTVIFILTSKCACPDGCPSALPPPPSPGMSTGSKLLIAFFTIVLAYFLIGIVWNYCNGSHGMELIPNIEFWNDLPTLIMEGITFACSCCAKQSSYGAV